ncbi:hypothetical protein HanPSC8_Chr05g0206041 [Helianthus annuus]|nr:hypothetical protein HanPSC8_Chr05g0206041 [Helianthus annuus]
MVRYKYVIGWKLLRALIRNLASSRCLKSVEQHLSFKIRLWILYFPL